MKRASPPRQRPRDQLRVLNTPEMLDLVRRRTLPYLERSSHLPLWQILAECYIQGMDDAQQAISR